MYRVIEYFEDLQDGGRSYNVGDVFPHGNKTVTDERLAELSSNKNRRRIPLIKMVDEPKAEKPKKVTKKAVEETEE